VLGFVFWIGTIYEYSILRASGRVSTATYIPPISDHTTAASTADRAGPNLTKPPSRCHEGNLPKGLKGGEETQRQARRRAKTPKEQRPHGFGK